MVYVIWGPPGSGKSTYVKSNMVDGDITIDFDLLYQAVTGIEDHKYEYGLFGRVTDLRNHMIASIPNYPEVRHTWVVMCSPDNRHWAMLEAMKAHFTCMDTPERECVRRCVKRGGDYDHWKSVVKKWFAENNSQNQLFGG